MRYDKQLKKQQAIQEELQTLRAENESLKKEASTMGEVLNSTLHEVRRFSALVSKFAERLSRETEEQPQINQTALSVLYTAGMISSRLAYTDIELNPRALESQIPVRSGIYKKFDKAKRILAEAARDKKITVTLIGKSLTEIETLPVFELLPFVLIENGIKYSPPTQTVEIHFEQIHNRQVVRIKSIGPTVNSAELPNLFDKGFRAASTSNMPGDGLGLFLAKRVCEYHDISISLHSGPKSSYQIGGIDYSEFEVTMRFPAP
ncbi:sensor histidine kinase KdpD [Herbaspirillum sp. GW103]|uniref:sensor histidine kinase n=1 Tax=Herbaspirillum sp. GW103 TaxID=1175306 RepID=UPI0009DA0545|nr:HAMP domain-containing sensor histidine kinase [Herbaspirillum sp. GW103]